MSFRAAVVGVGHLGRHHARIYARTPGVTLVAVADRDPARSAEVARACGTRGITDYRELPDDLDGVSIAVPTAAHHEVASHFLSHGISVLVEKPMTTTSREAESLVSLAREEGLHLQPGFVERFNPAIRAAASFLKSPRFIEAVRIAPLKFRSLDIGVVMDLMIHDLDIVLWLAGASPVSIEAVGVSVLTGQEDMVNARLKFANGCVADLTASRVAMKTVREIRVFQDDAYFSIDYAEQRVKACRKRPGVAIDPHAAAALAAGGMDLAALMSRFLDIQDVPIEEEEPLAAEIRAFVATVRDGAAGVVSGEAALEALRVAERIRAALRQPAAREGA